MGLRGCRLQIIKVPGFRRLRRCRPSNVSPLVRGAEMRDGRDACRQPGAPPKAYGIGLCSVEELGSTPNPLRPRGSAGKLPPQPVLASTMDCGGRKVRDHLCQIIRQHQLDPTS